MITLFITALQWTCGLGVIHNATHNVRTRLKNLSTNKVLLKNLCTDLSTSPPLPYILQNPRCQSISTMQSRHVHGVPSGVRDLRPQGSPGERVVPQDQGQGRAVQPGQEAHEGVLQEGRLRGVDREADRRGALLSISRDVIIIIIIITNPVEEGKR